LPITPVTPRRRAEASAACVVHRPGEHDVGAAAQLGDHRGREQPQPDRHPVRPLPAQPRPQPGQLERIADGQDAPHVRVAAERVEHSPLLGAHGHGYAARVPPQRRGDAWRDPARRALEVEQEPRVAGHHGEDLGQLRHDGVAPAGELGPLLPVEAAPDRLAMPDLQRVAVQVDVGLDEVDTGGEGGAQIGERVAGTVGDREQGTIVHIGKLAFARCRNVDPGATGG
jgi:hypothetical protein